MTFPVYFHLLGRTLHPHQVMEGTAYIVGFALQFHQRRRALRTEQAFGNHLWIALGALIGAIAGAKALALLESPAGYAQEVAAHGWLGLLGGKTIVGGLLGGWVGVELTKKLLREPASTGDAWVLPLSLSIAIGRVGCFLTGLSDQTCGTPTSLPWAVDFGDGIPRHPTQLYEIAFLLLLLIPLRWLQVRPHTPGIVFRWFILSYCAFRFAVEFIKPVERPYIGLSAIQWASLLAVLFCAYNLRAHTLAGRAQHAGSSLPLL